MEVVGGMGVVSLFTTIQYPYPPKIGKSSVKEISTFSITGGRLKFWSCIAVCKSLEEYFILPIVHVDANIDEEYFLIFRAFKNSSGS